MTRIIRRVAVGAATVVTGVGFMAAPAFAHECTNASKDAHNPGAGVQVILDVQNNFEPEWISTGLQQRIAHGATFDTFHGLVGFDLNSDGTAEVFTYLVGPTGELPETAQQNGSPDHGIVNICTVIDCSIFGGP